MNASYAFRSHLMQQFAAQARNQARPPLALFGLLTDDSNNNHLPQEDNAAGLAEVSRPPLWQQLSSIDDSSASNGVNLRRRHTDSDAFSSYSNNSNNHRSLFIPLHSRDLSACAACAEQAKNEDHVNGVLEGTFYLPLAFQNLLQTRRRTPQNRHWQLQPPSAPLPIAQEHEYWLAATERAVQCGYQASKRTEPFTFKRMIAPSVKTERLAEIAYHVTLRQAQGGASPTTTTTTKEDPRNTTTTTTTLPRDKVIMSNKQLHAAERKREKWSKIPAFLVATVKEEEEEPSQDKNLLLDNQQLQELQEHDYQYEPLPYVPPRTVHALEDYAAACAACQNVMLSLHAEHIATKWVTGNIVTTPAFRKLIQAKHTDRVVGIILVGQPAAAAAKQSTTATASSLSSSLNLKKQRRRRPVHSESAKNILSDL